jgi:putative FmdB family regulatory protein
MPSYDFVCQECGNPYEARLSMSAYSAGEGRECPKCGSTQVERAFTAVNVIAGGRSSGGSYGGSGSCGSSGFS